MGLRKGFVMSNKNNTPNVTGSVFQGISELLTSEGIDSKNFYQQFDLHPEIEQNPQVLVSFEIFINILEKIQEITSIKHPGLYLANHQTQQEITPYFELILNAPTLEVAFQIARRFRYVYSEVTYWDWAVENKFVLIKRCSFVPLKINDRKHCLYTIATVYLLLQYMLAADSKIERICLVQPEDDYRYELDRFFSCPISFAQDFDGFILTEQDFYKPIKQFDVKKYHQLSEQLAHHSVVFPENQNFSSVIKSLVLQSLSTGCCSLDHIAKQIDMHPRALQKRLSKEDLTFKLVLSDVRVNVAKRLLAQQDVSLIQISSMLGYSEASAFSRAFQAVNHCSPREWRKKHGPVTHIKIPD
jgi:AraC-like DNA-binding protein